MIHRVDDVMIVCRQLIRGFEPHILLQIAQIHGRPIKNPLGLCNGTFEPEHLVDEPDDVGFGRDHDTHRHLGHPGDIVNGLGVKRIGRGHHQGALLDGNGKHQVFHGETAGNGGGDQV